MYNLYKEEKIKEKNEEGIKKEKLRLITVKKYKGIQKKLVENYQRRVKQFIIDVF